MFTQVAEARPQTPSSSYLLPVEDVDSLQLFELLTLLQTGQVPALPVVLFDSACWRRIIDFDGLAEAGMASPEHCALFEYADTPEEAWRSIERRGLRAHA